MSMPPTPPDRILRAFATEVHCIAYTMPNGHEYGLLALASRMTAAADEQFHDRLHQEVSS